MKTQEAIDNFLRSRQSRNLSRLTIAWYEHKLRNFASSHPKLPLKPEPIEEFMSGTSGAPETRHAYYRALQALYFFVCRRHRWPNPMQLIDAPSCPKKVMPTLEAEDEMRLLNSASDLRARAILTLLIDSGIRTGELAGLRKQDIKVYTLTVRGKTGEREVPISDETRRLLLSLIAQDNKDGEYVFYGHKGVLSRHGIYRIVKDHMLKAGITGPKLGGHRIRHAFGKGYLVNGGDIRSLQQIMGHANITTTEKYAALNLNDTIEKHNKFTPLRSAHAAVQQSFLSEPEVLKEVEEILKGSSKGKHA